MVCGHRQPETQYACKTSTQGSYFRSVIPESLAGRSTLQDANPLAEGGRHHSHTCASISSDLDLCPFLWTLDGTDAGFLDLLQYAEPSRR